MVIQELDIEIQHRPGKANSNADALSRNPIPLQKSECEDAAVLSVESMNQSDSPVTTSQAHSFLGPLQAITECQRKDPDLSSIIDYLEKDTLPDDEKKAKKLLLESSQYDMLDGVLHNENPVAPGSWRVVVPKNLRQSLLEEAHSGWFAGHFSEKRIYENLRKKFWWRGMRSDTRRHCRSCLTCVSRRGANRIPHPPLQPIPVGGPFHRVGVDVLQLPLTEAGNHYVVVFQDYLTKWVEAFATPNQIAETIAHLLVNEICRHGVPEHLLSDRGANFLSELEQDVCKLLPIKKINTSGYHPQTDGLVEKFNSTLINMISKVAQSSGRDWDCHLPYLLFAYRASVHESTEESPFHLLYGRDPRLPSEAILNQPSSPYVVDSSDYRVELTSSLSSAWLLARERIKIAQSNQKKQHDKRAKEHRFQVSDRVMIHMPSAVTGKAWKLARPFHGPYRVLSVTPTNVEARLVDHPDVDPIFVAVSRVRPAIRSCRI